MVNIKSLEKDGLVGGKTFSFINISLIDDLLSTPKHHTMKNYERGERREVDV